MCTLNCNVSLSCPNAIMLILFFILDVKCHPRRFSSLHFKKNNNVEIVYVLLYSNSILLKDCCWKCSYCLWLFSMILKVEWCFFIGLGNASCAWRGWLQEHLVIKSTVRTQLFIPLTSRNIANSYSVGIYRCISLRALEKLMKYLNFILPSNIKSVIQNVKDFTVMLFIFVLIVTFSET